MPACPYRSWSTSDCSSNSRTENTAQKKEIDEKLKKLLADRNALDQHIQPSNMEAVKPSYSKKSN